MSLRGSPPNAFSCFFFFLVLGVRYCGYIYVFWTTVLLYSVAESLMLCLCFVCVCDNMGPALRRTTITMNLNWDSEQVTECVGTELSTKAEIVAAPENELWHVLSDSDRFWRWRPSDTRECLWTFLKSRSFRCAFQPGYKVCGVCATFFSSQRILGDYLLPGILLMSTHNT